MEFRVTHITKYEASDPVSVCHNLAWLTPRTSGGQTLRQHRIEIQPDPSTLGQRTDAFGNTVTQFSLNTGYTTLEVTAVSLVGLTARGILDRDRSPAWDQVSAQLLASTEAESLAAREFCFESPRIQHADELRDYARADFSEGRPIVEAIESLTDRIHNEFEFDPKATTVTTPVAEVMLQKRGVCQDFAHVQIGMLRSLGLAARYVSGYVRTHAPEGQPRLIGADASHAWLAVYCGELGWIDVDPTNNSFPELEHITVAWGRDYSDVTPLRGVYTGGGRHILDVSVDVAPLD